MSSGYLSNRCNNTPTQVDSARVTWHVRLISKIPTESGLVVVFYTFKGSRSISGSFSGLDFELSGFAVKGRTSISERGTLS